MEYVERLQHGSRPNLKQSLPSGSVLGPVLFLLYINDISEHIQSTLCLFADDSIVYREIKNICDHALLLKQFMLMG